VQVIIVRKWLMLGLFITVFSVVVSLAITGTVDRLAWNTSGYVPEPPPKPTMTVMLRMGDGLVKRWTVDIPTEKEPSWENFAIDPNTLKPAAKGLVECRLFISVDEN
jgi:hypothetical protein